jgi:shikimate kinase
MADNVILIGFMGAGKSSVGRLLARRLGRCFVETDDMIVGREGRSIPEIFASRGEAYFRALEEEMIGLLRLKRSDVIATGGGLPCGESRMESLKGLGRVVWLAGSFDALYERARRAGNRPMLTGRTREEVAALYDARQRFYRQADLTVDTGDLGVDQVAGRIVAALRAVAPAPTAGA